MNDLVRVPFDQYQRYRLVADVLGELRGAGGLSVLDVGGGSGLLQRFVPDDRVVAVDLEPQPGVGVQVRGDGCRLPFRDGAFDVVCAFDTLEHVAPEQRASFVRECRRAASRWVVLAGPCDSAPVRRARCGCSPAARRAGEAPGARRPRCR